MYKNILYIGQYGHGSTSKMRGEILKVLLSPDNYHVIDIEIPIKSTNKVLRSIGWRYKIGPLIDNINNLIIRSISPDVQKYDLIWIDKGVFIRPETTSVLRNLTPRLIHFTPDPAFTYHQSNLFFKSLNLYDYTITTKSFEIESYKAYGIKNVIYCTQGYDPNIHKPYFEFDEKEGISFIGHWEKDREDIIAQLIPIGPPIKLAGIGWERFVKRNKDKSNLKYLGKGVFGTDYAKVISSSLISLGFLSKIIPEQHTTRTIEIPACGTALITERTPETEKIFNNEDVCFIDNTAQWIPCIDEILKNPNKIQKISQSGFKNITSGQFDYESIIFNILQKCNLL